MKNLIERLGHILNESEVERMVHWAKTFGENHGVAPTEKGFFDVCVKHMTESMGEEGAKGYCARAIDATKGSTYWRGKGKDEGEAEKDVEEHPNYPKTKKGKKEREKALKD